MVEVFILEIIIRECKLQDYIDIALLNKNEMGYDLVASMQNGISNSRIVLVCLNSIYQTRENCMFELREASKCDPTKQIITLFIESNCQTWISDEVKELCQLNNLDLNNYLDVSELQNEDWNNSDEDGSVDEQKMFQLYSSLTPLINLIEKKNSTLI